MHFYVMDMRHRIFIKGHEKHNNNKVDVRAHVFSNLLLCLVRAPKIEWFGGLDGVMVDEGFGGWMGSWLGGSMESINKRTDVKQRGSTMASIRKR